MTTASAERSANTPTRSPAPTPSPESRAARFSTRPRSSPYDSDRGPSTIAIAFGQWRAVSAIALSTSRAEPDKLLCASKGRISRANSAASTSGSAETAISGSLLAPSSRTRRWSIHRSIVESSNRSVLYSSVANRLAADSRTASVRSNWAPSFGSTIGSISSCPSARRTGSSPKTNAGESRTSARCGRSKEIIA